MLVHILINTLIHTESEAIKTYTNGYLLIFECCNGAFFGADLIVALGAVTLAYVSVYVRVYI